MESLSWITPEYEYRHKTSDWFWGLGIIIVGAVVLAIIFGNLLFSMVILIGGGTLALHALRRPRDMEVELNDRGVLLNGDLYPYRTLESFWIHDHVTPNVLVITSKKPFMPRLHVPIVGVSDDEVREFLSTQLHEDEVLPSISEKILEVLGF